MVMVMVVMVLVVKVRDLLHGHYGNVPIMVQVRFETGPGGAQSVEVRVTDSATEAGADTLLTSGDSSEVPGSPRILREILVSGDGRCWGLFLVEIAY